ncbi:adenylosuccinate lyase [Tenacibaculum sp. 1B UA]|uniref:adenylosuccinate lyase n=1 Tax=unclassified Tenacibaculum TaxID=2635139 RepID=UPI0026E1B24E|nr:MULTISPECIES: adenylosuccinate lyase [unclassified Tenacibaculum]MDO6675160.1 adenylosuccinate lyase [Tenacibaculum sp. 1_MG-2023]MDX8552714.1 adenylosuccinate lyase [Tenacibaculum sp. 1B UA]
MSLDFLISVLENVDNPARVNRDNAANIVLKQPELVKFLVDITFDVDNKLSIKAAWVLEWICTHNGIEHITPFLAIFTKNISKVHFDSAVRPCAKICEHLATAFTSKTANKTKGQLTETDIDLIIETGFDWLITDQKIAVKAYTMNTLYLFGLQRDWVLPELEHLIRTKVIHESKGCKARGKKILELIEKHRL